MAGRATSKMSSCRGRMLAGVVVMLLASPLAAAPRASAAVDDPAYSVTLDAEGTPRGHVIAIHGGGWVGGTDRVDAAAAGLDYFTRWGWSVRAVGYRSGATSVEDVVAWFDRLSAEVDGPICAWGASAGGHLALMLALRRHLDCVIAEAPPVYLPETDEAWDLPDWGDPHVVEMFGLDMLEWYSPLRWHRSIAEPVLLGHARLDPLIPLAQSRVFDRRDDATQLVKLGSGKEVFTHTNVNATDLVAFRAAEHDLLRAAE